jgi:hypothetical protein
MAYGQARLKNKNVSQINLDILWLADDDIIMIILGGGMNRMIESECGR